MCLKVIKSRNDMKYVVNKCLKEIILSVFVKNREMNYHKKDRIDVVLYLKVIQFNFKIFKGFERKKIYDGIDLAKCLIESKLFIFDKKNILPIPLRKERCFQTPLQSSNNCF